MIDGIIGKDRTSRYSSQLREIDKGCCPRQLDNTRGTTSMTKRTGPEPGTMRYVGRGELNRIFLYFWVIRSRPTHPLAAWPSSLSPH